MHRQGQLGRRPDKEVAGEDDHVSEDEAQHLKKTSFSFLQSHLHTSNRNKTQQCCWQVQNTAEIVLSFQAIQSQFNHTTKLEIFLFLPQEIGLN